MPPVILTVAQNTFVSSMQPNDNFSYHPLLYAGTDEVFGTCISLLKFDFTTIATNTVESALLQLSVIVKSETPSVNVVVNRVTESFDAAYVTYDTIPGITATPSEIDISSEDLYKTVQIDVTQLVNDWLSGVHANHGLALTNLDGLSLVQFGSDKIVWEPYFPKLVLNYAVIPPEIEKTYGYIFNTNNDSINPEANVPFSNNGILRGVSHTTGSDNVTFEEDGTYAVWFSVTGSSPNQFALFLNDRLVRGSIYGIALPTFAPNEGMTIVSAQAGDKLTVKNHSSSAPVELAKTLGGTQLNVTASILVLKIGPAEEPIPPLVTVNQAQNETDMRAAITDPALGLNLAGFDAISGAQQVQVLAEVIAGRPVAGYADVTAIQSVLDHAVEYSVDYTNIYVAAGATDGVGNPSHPLGTIEAAIHAVEAGGTLHLAGTFESFNTLNITKEGVTLLGEGSAEIIPASDSIPVIINAPGVKLNGITIRNSDRRSTELVRIIAPEATIVNCNLSGPGKTVFPQLLAGITTVEERAANFLIENNRINSLDTAIHLLEFSDGAVAANNISDTRCGIKIDGAIARIVENNWLGLPNDADIVITADTPVGPPYYVEELIEMNNNAVVLDERTQI